MIAGSCAHMGAFNFINTGMNCPKCGAGPVMAQTYMAASFRGDASGRFCGRHYAVGEKMRWWPPGGPEFGAWIDRDYSLLVVDASGREGFEECCPGHCPACGEELYAVIRFVDLTACEVLDFGIE